MSQCLTDESNDVHKTMNSNNQRKGRSEGGTSPNWDSVKDKLLFSKLIHFIMNNFRKLCIDFDNSRFKTKYKKQYSFKILEAVFLLNFYKTVFNFCEK